MGKFTSFFLFLLSLISCITIVTLGMNFMMEKYVEYKTVGYVNTWKTTGQISTNEYEKLCKTVYRAGNYSINVTCSKKRIYATDNGYRYGYLTDGNETILKVMYGGSEKQNYKMNYGDKLNVEIIRNTPGVGIRLFQLLTGAYVPKQIILNIDEVVGNYAF